MNDSVPGPDDRADDPGSSEPSLRAGYRTMQELVVATLREGIVSGRFRPGERLEQARLCSAYGVSRTPLREALRQLSAEGLVDFVPHIGARVTPLDARDIEETFSLRSLLEGEAARLAVPRLEADDVSTLRGLLDQMQQFRSPGANEQYLKLDVQFHYALYRVAGHRRLQALIEQLRSASQRYRRAYTDLPPWINESADLHLDLFKACERRDADAAAEIVRQLLRLGATSLLASLKNAQADPALEDPAAHR